MTGRTHDRIVGAVVVTAALLAIWLYAEFSPYQRCIREQMANPEIGLAPQARHTAEAICTALAG